jgi:hypothetical protein
VLAGGAWKGILCEGKNKVTILGEKGSEVEIAGADVAPLMGVLQAQLP